MRTQEEIWKALFEGKILTNGTDKIKLVNGILRTTKGLPYRFINPQVWKEIKRKT